jgi:hypothetical protein
MNSIFILLHTYPLSSGEDYTDMVSAHPTREVAKSCERFYREYSTAFERNQGHDTEIVEIPFETS